MTQQTNQQLYNDLDGSAACAGATATDITSTGMVITSVTDTDTVTAGETATDAVTASETTTGAAGVTARKAPADRATAAHPMPRYTPAEDPTRAAERKALTMFRRHLHRIPELDFNLPETIAYVTEQLNKARDLVAESHGEDACTVFSPCKSAVCAFFDRGSQHATAIRSDMDALPVTEMTMMPYASQHKGRMHACGHDGHMSMVLALAQWLAAYFDDLPRSVLLVFQPAEETTGGANDICKSGVFERYNVDRIFGFHLWPDLPAGQIASRPGALLAAANETTAMFYGKSTHIAKAADGADALEACARFYLDAYDYMAQREKEEPCLLKFGHMEAGTVRNAIAGRAVVEGSLRTFSVEMGERCRRELPELAKKRAEETGCACNVYFADGYPPVVNDVALYEIAAKALAAADARRNAGACGQAAAQGKVAGQTANTDRPATGREAADRQADEAGKRQTVALEAPQPSVDIVGAPHFVRDETTILPTPAPALTPVELPDPLLIAEDFAFYQRHLPGVFLLLGTGTGIPLHSDVFDFDESILLQGLDAYKALVMIP